MKTDRLFDFSDTVVERLFLSEKYPWEALSSLDEYIRRVGRGLDKRSFAEVKRGVWVSHGAAVSESASLIAPLIIEDGAEVGNGSVVAASILGKGCMIGSFCEVRRCVFSELSRAPAHNYVSDSIVGRRARLGAGAVVSGVRGDRKEIVLELDGEKINTGMKRLGSLIGDGAEIGPSAVLSAGCVVEKGASVNPLTRARGYISAGKAYRGERIVYDLL